jgi:hypothetical protein
MIRDLSFTLNQKTSNAADKIENRIDDEIRRIERKATLFFYEHISNGNFFAVESNNTEYISSMYHR